MQWFLNSKVQYTSKIRVEYDFVCFLTLYVTVKRKWYSNDPNKRAGCNFDKKIDKRAAQNKRAWRNFAQNTTNKSAG